MLAEIKGGLAAAVPDAASAAAAALSAPTAPLMGGEGHCLATELP